MIMKLLFSKGALCFFVLFSYGCQSGEKESSVEPSEISVEKLTGRWELVAARRDGKLTQVLDNTYFIFSGDSLMTNLPSKEGRYKFKKMDNEIVTQEVSPTFYKIHSIYTDTMEFSVNLQGYLFEFTLASHTDKNHKEES